MNITPLATLPPAAPEGETEWPDVIGGHASPEPPLSLADATERLGADQPMQSDSLAYFTRTDPGQSLPGDCKHEFHAIGGGKFKCHWCPLVLPAQEP